jgi:peroxiredoxin
LRISDCLPDSERPDFTALRRSFKLRAITVASRLTVSENRRWTWAVKLERKQLVEGDRAPEFEFVTRDAKRLRSSELLRQGPLLLTFYRGAWCMCCQSDLRDLMRAMPAIRRTGSTVLGVFHDLGPEGNDRIVSEYGLDFPLVDDADGSVAEAFRACQYVLKPARCQRTTVSGLTIFKASRTPGASRYNPANTRRSMLVKVIRCGDLRRSTLS